MCKEIVYGIDLGTTYSCLAYVAEDGNVVVVKDLIANTSTIPSAVLMSGEETIVGATAKKDALDEADNYAALFKREMGKPEAMFTLGGNKRSPEELSASVLKALVENANKVLKSRGIIEKDVAKAVITYPAYFDDAQRKATRAAAEIAGLQLLDIIEEPIAAAISYVNTANVSAPKNILVYDLGGGTFDITLVHYRQDGVLSVLCHDGDALLGGADWDELLVDGFILQLSEENGVSDEELRDELDLMIALRSEAEELKIKLTSLDEAYITVKSSHINNSSKKQKLTISRANFEKLTKAKLERTIELIDKMYDDNKDRNLPQPDEILLVGGSTKMPQVINRLRAKYPNIPINTPDPDEAVAKGAAFNADEINKNMIEQIASGEGGADLPPINKKVERRATRTYGVRCFINNKEVIRNVVMIHETATDRIAVADYFQTREENQDSVEVAIYESRSDKEVIEIDEAKLIVSDLLPLSGKSKKHSPIIIEFDMSFGNMLRIQSKDPETGKTITMEYLPEGALTSEQIATAKKHLDVTFKAK